YPPIHGRIHHGSLDGAHLYIKTVPARAPAPATCAPGPAWVAPARAARAHRHAARAGTAKTVADAPRKFFPTPATEATDPLARGGSRGPRRSAHARAALSVAGPRQDAPHHGPRGSGGAGARRGAGPEAALGLLHRRGHVRLD